MESRLVILTLLAGIGFFNYHDMVSQPLQRAMFMFMMFVCAAWALKENRAKLRDSGFPRVPWFIFMIMLLISPFMASFYHPQSLSASTVTMSTTIMAYGFFFILLKLNPDGRQLIKGLFYLSGVSILIYAANLVTFPNNIFGAPILNDLSRGMPRVPIPFFQGILLLVFYSINRWQLDRGWLWIMLIGIGGMMILVSLTRQVILIMTVLCFFQILRNVSFWKKIGLGIVIISAGYAILINLPIYQSMKEVSEEQLEATVDYDKEDTRVGAWRYYAYEANEDIETLLLGNGLPSLGKTVWGKQFDAFCEETGYFIADVSWASIVFMTGIIGAVVLLAIVIMAIFKKKRQEDEYLTYFMICVLLQGIASGVWFYHNEIIVTMIALFLIYRSNDIPHKDNGVYTQQRLFKVK